MRTEKEIFNQIANSIIDILPKGITFKHTVLEIKRLEGNIGFTGFYLTEEDEKKWLDIFSFELDYSYIEDLYQTTQNHPLEHKNWNRAKYTLFPEGKMNIEYIWDQELQDEIDKANDSVQIVHKKEEIDWNSFISILDKIQIASLNETGEKELKILLAKIENSPIYIKKEENQILVSNKSDLQNLIDQYDSSIKLSEIT